MTGLRWPAIAAMLAAACLPAPGWAERMERLGRFEAHYNLVPVMLLSAAAVADYGVVRGRDRALLTVSILDPDGQPVQARLSGTVKDLLGQTRELELREVVEGASVYYLAEIRHLDEQVLRFAIDVVTPDGARHRLEFQQKLYVEP